MLPLKRSHSVEFTVHGYCHQYDNAAAGVQQPLARCLALVWLPDTAQVPAMLF